MRDLVTNDVFTMSRILKKLAIKPEIESGTTQEQAGAQLILGILENLHLAQKEINDFLGSLVKMTGKEFGELPIGESLKYIEEFKNKPGVVDFLKSAGRLTK